MDPLDFRIQYSEFFVFYMYIKLILLTSSLLNIYFFCSQISTYRAFSPSFWPHLNAILYYFFIVDLLHLHECEMRNFNGE